MKYAGWLGTALVAGWLGCGGQLDAPAGSPSTRAQAGAPSGGTAGAGASTPGGAAGAGLSGASGQSGSTPVGGQAGGGQAGGSSGGSAGQGAELLPGCDWHAQLLAKAEATSGPLHGLICLRPDGSAETLPIKLVNPVVAPHEVKNEDPSSGFSWTSVWTIVGATGTHVLLTGWTEKDQKALVAVSKTPGEPAVVLDANVTDVATAYQLGTPGQISGVLYYMQYFPMVPGWRLRRLDLTDLTAPPETAAEGKGIALVDTVVLAGDDLYLSSPAELRRFHKGKLALEHITFSLLQGEPMGGFTVLGDRLLIVGYGPQEGVESDLRTFALKDEGMTLLEERKISRSFGLRTVHDAKGQPAVGFVSYGGLFTMAMELPIKFSLVWQAPTNDRMRFRGRMEDGVVGTEPGYFVDVVCDDKGSTFAPAFVTRQGELRMRASEPGFPFVQPLPWANHGLPERMPQHGDTSGIYVLRD